VKVGVITVVQESARAAVSADTPPRRISGSAAGPIARTRASPSTPIRRKASRTFRYPKAPVRFLEGMQVFLFLRERFR